MLITAFEQADAGTRTELMHWITAGDYMPEQKIAAVTAIYNKEKIGELCQKKIEDYYGQGMRLLEQVQVPQENKRHLLDFVVGLMHRNL